MFKPRIHQQIGFSLIESLIALGIASIVALAFFKLWGHTRAVSLELANRKSVYEISNRIRGQISCEKTLAPFGNTTIPANTQIILRSTANEPLVNLARPATNASPLAGGHQVIGRWFLRAMWNGASIRVDIGKSTKDGLYVEKSMMRDQDLDYTYPSHQIYGEGDGSVPLCSAQQSKGYYSQLEFVTSGEMIDLMNWSISPSQRTVAQIIRYPIYLEIGCQEYCKSKNYRAGWPREYSDEYHILSNIGSFVSTQPYPNGKSAIWCGCVR